MEFVLLSLANYPVCGQGDVFCMDCDYWMSPDGHWWCEATFKTAWGCLEDGEGVWVVACRCLMCLQVWSADYGDRAVKQDTRSRSFPYDNT